MNNGATGPSRALYAALAPIYDSWQSLGGVTPFWALALDRLESALRRRSPSPPSGSFIDLGCGTGELLLALHRQHPRWRLAGVDASEAMLAMARAKTGSDRVSWIACALEDLDSDPDALAGIGAGVGDAAVPNFAVAGAFHDTINHLPDDAALEKTFLALGRGVLAPHGLLVFDVTNELGFRTWWTGNRSWTGAGWRIETAYSFHPENVGGTGRATVTIEHEGKIVRADLTQRCFSEESIRSALERAGFAVESATPWSPFDIDASGKTLFVAIKSS